MWLMNYITRNSLSAPKAAKGNIDKNSLDGVAINASGQHKNVKSCMPYGVFSVPASGSKGVVLPLDDGEISLGVVNDVKGLEEGELMLYSKGGASIVLKNNGKVIINGKEFSNG